MPNCWSIRITRAQSPRCLRNCGEEPCIQAGAIGSFWIHMPNYFAMREQIESDLMDTKSRVVSSIRWPKFRMTGVILLLLGLRLPGEENAFYLVCVSNEKS